MSDPTRLPSPTLRITHANALAALARCDAPEFERLSLDVAGLLGRVAEVDQVRAELRTQALFDDAFSFAGFSGPDEIVVVEFVPLLDRMAEVERAADAVLVAVGTWRERCFAGAKRVERRALLRVLAEAHDAHRAALRAYDAESQELDELEAA